MTAPARDARTTGRRPFIVGCRTRKTTTLVVLQRRVPPVRGPWTVELVVAGGWAASSSGAACAPSAGTSR